MHKEDITWGFSPKATTRKNARWRVKHNAHFAQHLRVFVVMRVSVRIHHVSTTMIFQIQHTTIIDVNRCYSCWLFDAYWQQRGAWAVRCKSLRLALPIFFFFVRFLQNLLAAYDETCLCTLNLSSPQFNWRTARVTAIKFNGYILHKSLLIISLIIVLHNCLTLK